MSSTDTCLDSFSVTESFLRPDQTFPVVIEPAINGIDLIAWVKKHWESVESHLLKEGAILFRGFKIDNWTGGKEETKKRAEAVKC